MRPEFDTMLGMLASSHGKTGSVFLTTNDRLCVIRLLCAVASSVALKTDDFPLCFLLRPLFSLISGNRLCVSVLTIDKHAF